MAKYNKRDPDKVHVVNGHPVIYNKVDKPITQWEAERGFKAAVNTMQTWATRAFRLAIATPPGDLDLRDYHLEHFEWELDNIAVWIGSMRQALEEAQGKQREQAKIDAMLALAERTTFPEEAATARRMAEERQRRQEPQA